MTAARALGVAFVLGLAILAAPYAVPPGVNAADLIVIAAPGALLLIVGRPRPDKTPAGGDATPPRSGRLPEGLTLPAGPLPLSPPHPSEGMDMALYDAALAQSERVTLSIETVRHLLWIEGDTNLGLDGGHFIAALIYTIRHADDENRAKLRTVYPEYVDGVVTLIREAWAFDWLRALAKAEFYRADLGLDLSAVAS